MSTIELARQLPEKTLLETRRSVLLSYPVYLRHMQEYVDCFEVVSDENVRARLGAGSADEDDLYAVASALEQRAWYGVNLMHLQFSAGCSVARIADFCLTSIGWWEAYGQYHDQYLTAAGRPGAVAHMPLAEDWYWNAIRMLSFGLLLGHTAEASRLVSLWDYGGQALDGLLERCVGGLVHRTDPPPDECRNHLPYFKLLKVFSAAPEDRPALMAQYMDDWYEASRREPYYRSHTKGRDHNFLGYWSFEAAAVSVLLDIDDSSYRDHEFYPKDMADFGRAHRQGPVADAADASGGIRLRCEAGQPCPREGEWETPAQANSRRNFQQGEVMPSVGGDYGQTIWQWVGESDV